MLSAGIIEVLQFHVLLALWSDAKEIKEFSMERYSYVKGTK